MATNPNFTGVLGVGTDNYLYSRPSIQSGQWTKIPNLPNNFLGIKITSSNFIAVMKNNTVSQATSPTGPWTPVPASGSVICVTVVPANSYGFVPGSWLGIGTDNKLYSRPGAGGAWVNIPGPGAVLSIVFAADGTLLGVGTDNNVYTYTGNATSSNWLVIPASGQVKWFCFGGTTGTTLYGIGMQGTVWYTPDFRHIAWTEIGNTAAVISIDMSGVGGG